MKRIAEYVSLIFAHVLKTAQGFDTPTPLCSNRGMSGDKSAEQNQILREGTVVLYDQDGQTQLAVITELKEKKAKLLSMRARDIDLAIARLDPLPGGIPSQHTSSQERADYLLELRETALTGAEDIPVEELWGFASEEAREYTGGELTELYYGSNSLLEHLTLRLALHSDRIYFKRKRHHFLPRPKETVEELHKAEDAAKEKQRLLDLTLDECVAALGNSDDHQFSKDTERLLAEIEKVAAGSAHVDNAAHKEVKSFLEKFEEKTGKTLLGAREERAYTFSSSIGRLHTKSNLPFIRHGLPTPFSEEVLHEAAEHPWPTATPSEHRVDLRDLDVVTIDDESTKDMDDGISLEITPDGYRVGIHITDISSLIPKGSALDIAATERATSLYFPEETINMFPDEIAAREGSLLKDHDRLAVSCLVSFSKLHEITDHQICLSVVRSKQRLSYTEVDQLLHPPSGEIGTLYELAMSYASSRLARGGLKIPKRGARVIIENKDDLMHSDFMVEEFSDQTPARELVGEMMILCNETLSQFADTHDIPFFYRSQEQPDPGKREALSDVPPGPAYDAALRGTLKRSVLSTSPAPHATLGVDYYGQVTSPIRRYGDLVNQRQIVAHLLGEPLPYNEQDLATVLAETSETLQRGRLLNRDTHRMWMLRYLEQKAKRKETIEGTIVRHDGPQYQVELEEVFIPALLKKTSTKLHRGDRVKLSIQAADSRYDYLKLNLQEKLPPTE